MERNALSPAMLDGLRSELSVQNPAYLNRIRMGLHPGLAPRMLCFLREQGERVQVPRGAVRIVRRIAEQAGCELEIEDRRVLPSARLERLRPVSLRDYQSRAASELVRATQGTVVIPCGGGKTRVALGAIERLRTPTLVLVHTLDLAEQWCSEVRQRLGVHPGLVGDGQEQIEPITIAVIQTLARWDLSALEPFLASFGFMVLDEAHHVAASTFYSIVDLCPARYRLGLTATPEREDGLTPLLRLFLGEPLVVVTHDELVAAGVLDLPVIRTLETDFTYYYASADDYAAMMDAVTRDAERNRLIVDTVANEAHAGHVCLVLSGRIEHCELLAEAVQARGVRAQALTGNVKRTERKALLDQARSGKLSVLVATSVADEGLDLPRLSRLFLAFPGRARGRTIQRLGRLMRPHPEKRSAVLYDFVDRKVPILRYHHNERLRLFSDVLGVRAIKKAS